MIAWSEKGCSGKQDARFTLRKLKATSGRVMRCRPGCAACCVVPSISTGMPGMPEGKPAFVPCPQLDLETRKCRIWREDGYPDVCRDFTPAPDSCGKTAGEAYYLLTAAELLTTPDEPADDD